MQDKCCKVPFRLAQYIAWCFLYSKNRNRIESVSINGLSRLTTFPQSVFALERQRDQIVFIFNAFIFDWSVPPPGVYKRISIECGESLMICVSETTSLNKHFNQPTHARVSCKQVILANHVTGRSSPAALKSNYF